MWGKHYASMYTGSMCGAGPDVFTVWGYVISHTVDSQVELNPMYLAPILGMTVEQVQRAIDYLSQPDERSRSPQENGRRIVKEKAFSYRVPTHDTYRGLRNEAERREYFRIKKAEQRLRDVKASSKRVVKMSTHTEAEAEADTEALPQIHPKGSSGENGKDPEKVRKSKSVATRPR